MRVWRWTRRQLGVVAAGAALTWGRYAAAAGGGKGTAGPAPVHGGITLTFSPWTTGGTWTPSVRALLQEAMQGFERGHPGVRVQLVPPPGGCCNPAALTAALVAGTAPDVVLNNNFGGYAVGGYFLPLDPYLRRDNIDPGIWSPAQIQSFRSWTTGDLLALPTYFNTTVYLVNLSAFDTAGLAYPDPGWTHEEFLTTARRLTTTQGGQRRFGCNLWFWTGQAWGSDWIFRAFGGAKVKGGGVQCGLELPGSLAAGEWIYQDVVWPQLGTMQNTYGGYIHQLVSGQTVMSVQQTGDLLTAVTELANTGMKWDIFPFPVFPAGRACFGGDQFYAISALTRYPDQAWELLKWVAAGSQWQRAVIRMFLMAPALNALWPEWIRLVQAVAPPLRGKSVQWFADAAVRGYAYPTSYFRYADQEAEGIIQGYFAQLFARQISVRTAFQQATQQVDSLEASAASAPGPTLAQQRGVWQQEQRRLARMFARG